MRNMKLSILMISALSLAVLLNGCGSSSRESSSSPANVAKVSEAACAQCHGSARSSVTAAYLYDEYKNSKHFIAAGVGCQDCHGGGSQHSGIGPMPYPKPDSAGICVGCHTKTSLGAHFATYTTSLAAQYVSQSDTANGQCRQCHNPHDTTSLIQYNRDWAESGHGDIGYVPGNANASSVNSHYPWTTVSRDSCSKCHTTTGYKNFTDGLGTPYMSNNKKNEAVMCSACHNDYSWTRRDIGAQTLEYKYNGAAVVLPDPGDSNLCLVCHGGRGNVQSARSTRFEGHHAATGADLFAEFSHVGFEFTGQNYTKKSYFAHDSIGIADGSGPCVSCHMKSTSSHTFGVVTKDANGVITAINTQAVCDTCHSGAYAMTAAKLEEEAEGYKEAGVILKALLANTITNYKNTKVVISTTDQAKAASEGDYGSFQNSLYPTEDPGGFAHNRYYVKRLLFDSIDWMQHGAFTGSITINATTYPEAAAWFGAAAGTGIATRP